MTGNHVQYKGIEIDEWNINGTLVYSAEIDGTKVETPNYTDLLDFIDSRLGGTAYGQD